METIGGCQVWVRLGSIAKMNERPQMNERQIHHQMQFQQVQQMHRQQIQQQQIYRIQQLQMQQQQQQLPELVLQTFMICDVLVLKVRKGPQILYKLANAQIVNQLSPLKRQQLTAEILKLHALDSRRLPMNGGLPYPPDITHQLQVRQRVLEALKSDHEMVTCRPEDINRPFRDLDDAMDRLLPFHIFNYPDEEIVQSEKEAQQFQMANQSNLEYFKRRQSEINARFSNILKRAGSVSNNNVLIECYNNDYN